MKISVTLLSVLMIAGSAPLVMAAPNAATERVKPMSRLERLDSDGDRRISAAEWAAREGRARPKAFDRLDANHDGFVDLPELQAKVRQARRIAERTAARAERRAERLEKRAGQG